MDERRRRLALLAVVLAAGVILAGVAGATQTASAGAEEEPDLGFVFSCPEPDTDGGALQLQKAEITGGQLTVEWIGADGKPDSAEPSAPQVKAMLPDPLKLLSQDMVLGSKFPVDTDGDGTDDLWIELNLFKGWFFAAGGNVLDAIIDEYKARLQYLKLADDWNNPIPPFGVGIKVGRATTGGGPAPVEVSVRVDLQLTMADGTVAAQPVRLGWRGLDTATGKADLPDSVLFRLAFRPVGPYNDFLTMLLASIKYEGLDEADFPPSEVFAVSQDDFDVTLGWPQSTPTQFGITNMSRCYEAKDTESVDFEPQGPYDFVGVAHTGMPADGYLDYVSGPSTGIAGNPEMDLHVDAAGLPGVADLLFEEDRVTVHRHAVDVLYDPDKADPKISVQPQSPDTYSPTDLDLFYADAEVGTEPVEVGVAADSISDWSIIEIADAPDGSVGSADAGFCNGIGGLEGCAGSVGGPGEIAFYYQNFLSGDGEAPPPLPVAERYVHYAETTSSDNELFRFGARLAAPEHITYTADTEGEKSTRRVTAQTALSLDVLNGNTVLDIDVAEKGLLANPESTHLAIDGTVASLPALLDLSWTTDPATGSSALLDYKANAKTDLDIRVADSAGGIEIDSQGDVWTSSETLADLSVGDQGNGGVPTAFTLELLESASGTTDSVVWTADTAGTALAVDEIHFEKQNTVLPVPLVEGLYVAGGVTGLPERMTVDMTDSPTGQAVDARFCLGPWGTQDCNDATVQYADLVDIVVQNFPLATNPGGLEPAPDTARAIGYSRNEVDVGTAWWRAAGRLAGLERFNLASAAPQPDLEDYVLAGVRTRPDPPPGETADLSNDAVAIAIDTIAGADTFSLDGSITSLPAVVDQFGLATLTPGPLTARLLGYKASSPVQLDADFETVRTDPAGFELVTTGSFAGTLPEQMTAVVVDLEGSPDRHIFWHANEAIPELDVSLKASSSAPDDEPLVVDAELTNAHNEGMIELLYWGDESFRLAEIRFCKGPWDGVGCQNAAGQADEIRLTARNHDPATSWIVQPLPPPGTPGVTYDAIEDPSGATDDLHWRAHMQLGSVRRLGVATMPVDAASWLGIDDLYQAAAVVDTAAGANSAVAVRFDADKAAAGPCLPKGPRRHMHVNATLDTLPASVTALATSATDCKPFPDDSSRLSVSVRASAPVTGKAYAFRDLSPIFRELEGELAIAPTEQTPPDAPLKLDFSLTSGPWCPGLDYDTSGPSALQRGCFSLDSNQRMHLQAGAVYTPASETIAAFGALKVTRPIWYQLHTDTVMPNTVDANWRTGNDGLHHFEANAQCRHGESPPRTYPRRPAIPCNDVAATLVRHPERPNTADPGFDFLAEPAPESLFPEITTPEHQERFPAFSTEYQGVPVEQDVTYHWLAKDRWRVHGRMHDLHKVSYTRTFAGKGERTDVCVESQPSAAASGPVTAGVYHRSLPALDLPFYADAIVNRRPKRIGLTYLDVDEQFQDGQETSPLAWFSLEQCHPDLETDLPSPSELGAQTSSDVTVDLLVRGGDVGYLDELLDVGPADRTPGRSKGLDAHLQVDAAALEADDASSGLPKAALDATALLDIPDKLVISSFAWDRCSWTMPPVDYLVCHEGLHYEPDKTSQAELSILSTLASFGRLDALVRLRDEASGTTETVAGHLPALPGSFEGGFEMRENRRLHRTDIGVRFDSTAKGLVTGTPPLGDIAVEVWDDSSPAYKLGIEDDAHRVPNYRAEVGDIGPVLDIGATFYAPEKPNAWSVPEPYPPEACALPYREGPSGELAYLDARIDAGGHADDLEVFAGSYPDRLGRQVFEVTNGGKPINAIVDAKLLRLRVGESESKEVFGPLVTAEFETCFDADLPVRLQAEDVRRLRLSGDGIEWILANDDEGGKSELRIEEHYTDPTDSDAPEVTQPGAWFAQQHTIFDPPDVVTYEKNKYVTNYTGQYKDIYAVRESTDYAEDTAWYEWPPLDSPFAPGNVWAYWWWCSDSGGGNWPTKSKNSCPEPNRVAVEDLKVWLDAEPYWQGTIGFLHNNLFPDADESYIGTHFILDFFFDYKTLGDLRERDEDDKLAGRPGEELWISIKSKGIPLTAEPSFAAPTLEPGDAGGPVSKWGACPGQDDVAGPYGPQPDLSLATGDGTLLTLECHVAIVDQWNPEEKETRFRLRATDAFGVTRYLHGHESEGAAAYLGSNGMPWLAAYKWLKPLPPPIGFLDMPVLQRKLEVLPSGHVRLSFRHLYAPYSSGGPETVFVFDPSGNGGPIGHAYPAGSYGMYVPAPTQAVSAELEPLEISAVVGQPATLQESLGTAGCVAGLDCTKRWYFGDGESAEGYKVTHTYALPGDYPALIVVFDGTGYQVGTRQVNVSVH